MKHITISLVIILLSLIHSPVAQAATSFDFNNDSKVNYLDLKLYIQNQLSQTMLFDGNKNGVVDIFDFSGLISRLNSTTPPTSTPHPSATSTPAPNHTPTPTPPPGSLKTKKWHPGHYYQMSNNVTPEEFSNIMTQEGSEYMSGGRVQMYWSDFELNKDQYSRDKLDQYLQELPANKKLIIMLWERDYWGRTCDKNARLPAYIKNPNQPHPALNINIDKGCVAQFWQPDIQERWIKLNQKVAEYVDNDNRVEAIVFPETAFGIPVSYEDKAQAFKTLTYNAWIAIHTAIAPSYQRTQVFHQMNHLGPNCEQLDPLANHLRSLGHGISNPDSPPWDALPADCGESTSNYQNTYPNLLSRDNPKPVFSIFRRVKNTMPVMVGGDTSFYEDPENPRTFNGEVMNYTNLVKYLYLSAVKGYTYVPSNPDIAVSSLGANYQMWNNHYSSEAGGRSKPDSPISVGEYGRRFKAAYHAFLSNPANTTNTKCPTNIRCQP
jgi:hypothetical protein